MASTFGERRHKQTENERKNKSTARKRIERPNGKTKNKVRVRQEDYILKKCPYFRSLRFITCLQEAVVTNPDKCINIQ